MGAQVLPFTGQWQGRIEPTPYQGRVQARGVHDARLIMAAKRENDDWTARLLLALLETMTKEQLEKLEFRLLGPNCDSHSAVEALAIVQLATCGTEHRESVKTALDRLAAREAE